MGVKTKQNKMLEKVSPTRTRAPKGLCVNF